ncbi:AraC family transcriptional regulator, partial [Salmonella enterica subsp. enterica]|nr:AraC family transcriptional regulator [Salmonella enterica subsp. enterica serovar Mbandaka]
MKVLCKNLFYMQNMVMNNETLCAIARQLLKQQQASNSSIVEGLLPTCSPDIDLFYQTCAQELRPTLYAPGLVFLFSGEKSVQLGQNYYVYNPSKALLLTGVYPVYCNIRASEQEPVIGIQIRFERKQVAQLLHHLTVHSGSTSEQMAAAHSHSGFLSVQVTPAIQTALYGLLNALGNPVTCDLFMPTHIQTLVYAALEQADVCAFIREWLEQDGSFAQFLQASEFLLRQLDQPVTLHDLASHMGMSIPTLQRRF